MQVNLKSITNCIGTPLKQEQHRACPYGYSNFDMHHKTINANQERIVVTDSFNGHQYEITVTRVADIP